MGSSTEWWCVCRKYCRGQRIRLKSERTWYRHLQHSAEDEKEAIRVAHLSDHFRAQLASFSATSSASLRRPRPDSDEGETDARPRQRQRIDADEVCNVSSMFILTLTSRRC